MNKNNETQPNVNRFSNFDNFLRGQIEIQKQFFYYIFYAKIPENVNKINANWSQKFKTQYLALENEIKKIFLIPYSTLDGLSNDTTHSHLR